MVKHEQYKEVYCKGGQQLRKQGRQIATKNGKGYTKRNEYLTAFSVSTAAATHMDWLTAV
jgi:hypothetical protein